MESITDVEPHVRRISSERLSAETGSPLYPTVFHEPWWLDAASGGAWEEVTIEDGGKTVARFPFIVERGLLGARRSTLPELTHFLGPAIYPGTGAKVNQSLKYYDRLRRVVEKADRYDGFQHELFRRSGDVLYFRDAGFKIDVKFTYVVQPDTLDTVWANMRDKTRNVIRRAEKSWSVDLWNDPDAFSDFYGRRLEARGARNYYHRIKQVCSAAIERDRGMILSAKDEHGVVRAAIFVVSDGKTAYYRLTSRDQTVDNGVISLLIWEAMKVVIREGREFDFDALGGPGARLFYNGFGGTIEHSYIVSRYRDPRWPLQMIARDWRRRATMTAARASDATSV